MNSGVDRLLHRAPWVVTTTGAATQIVVSDGGVLTGGGRILAVGAFNELKKEHAALRIIDHQGCILTPALVNGHTHLELSHLAEMGREETAGEGQFPVDYFTDWIRRLLSRRRDFAAAAGGKPEAEIIACGREALDSLHRNGTVLVADIGNQLVSRGIGDSRTIDVVFLLELYGLAGRTEKTALKRLDSEIDSNVYCTPHAPYSAGPELIRQLKERSRTLGHVMSIHTAETWEEDEFMRSGSGSFRRFLEEIGEWDKSFSVPGTGSVAYLERLGVLDPATMCVHMVHVSEDEIEMIRKSGARVCLCPGSNRRLGTGRAPAADFLARGILPALGTDSLASNKELNLWQEMRILRQDHPGLEPAMVFAMASLGGAAALGAAGIAGSLSPGAAGRFLALAADRDVRSTEDVFEYLTSAVDTTLLSWVG